MKLPRAFRRAYPTVPTSCDGADFALQAIAASRNRGNPERSYQAHRAGIFARLVQGERVDELDAEHWIGRWEREAETTGRGRGSGFWDDGWNWIAEHRTSKGP